MHFICQKRQIKLLSDLITCSYSNPAKFWEAVNSNENKSTTSLPAHIKYGDCLISEQKVVCLVLNRHFADVGHSMSPDNVFEALQTIESRTSIGQDKLHFFFQLSQSTWRGR